MGKRILGVISAVLVLSSCFCGPALADGGLFGKGGRDISEPEQKAVIFFHAGMEELVLSVRYDGASEDFAWLVPTPGVPSVEESDTNLFWLMSEITPTPAGYGWEYLNERHKGQMMDSAGVDVIDELTVGAFDLTVLRADDAGDLRSWLEERGFAYDEEAEEVLADYIERDWCFTAMRINPSFQDPDSGYIEYELSEGVIDPLRFTFETPEPVYPLRISSLNPGTTEVLLYVLGPEAYVSGNMEIEYAERWQPVQIAALADFSELAKELEKDDGCCITKLRKEFSPDEMEDLYFVPLDDGQLTQWASFTAASGGGGSVPWWVMLVIALGMAMLAGAAYALFGGRREGWPVKTLAVFLAVALAGSAILVPLGIWVFPGDKDEIFMAHADWPWGDGILVNQGGWTKLIHPDGRMEIQGLAEYLLWTTETEEIEPVDYDGDPVMAGGELDEAGRWEWSLRHHREDDWQTQYLAVTDGESGEVYEADIGMKEVHDVRLSPQGDRLWIAMNPGVPVNKTEAQEYAFPSLELIRSVIHDDCMFIGEIVISPQGEPLLAGRFETVEEYEEHWDSYFGFLPMFEENAGYIGEPFVIKSDEMSSGEDKRLIGILNGYNCQAADASPFLLLGGYDYESGDSLVFVLDTNDGSIYEVCEGSPVGWQ